jgi:hypothetical protein
MAERSCMGLPAQVHLRFPASSPSLNWRPGDLHKQGPMRLSRVTAVPIAGRLVFAQKSIQQPDSRICLHSMLTPPALHVAPCSHSTSIPERSVARKSKMGMALCEPRDNAPRG